MVRASRPTARDVAALAGVSVATVSYVLTGRDEGRVGPEARERVIAAARQLAYAPDQSARSLRRRRTQQVCVVVSSVGVPTLDRLTRDLLAAADEHGYGVITLIVDSEARARQAVSVLHSRIADGAVISVGYHHLTDEALAELARAGLPLVVMSNTAEPAGFDVVRSPEATACGQALDHLLAQGRRRIAFIAHHDEQDLTRPSERLRAYLDALDRHGIPADPHLVVPGADDRVAAYRAARALLARPAPPDAIFASSDRAAISVVWAARDAGRRLPDDLAVVGVGNLDEGLITNPPLSTVGPASQDYRQVGRLLFERVLGEEPLAGREVVTPWSFVRRGSA